jgi:hypothetical protein
MKRWCAGSVGVVVSSILISRSYASPRFSRRKRSTSTAKSRAGTVHHRAQPRGVAEDMDRIGSGEKVLTDVLSLDSLPE